MSSKAVYDDVNSGTLSLMAVYSVIITFISIVGCQVIYFAMQQRQDLRKQLQTEYTDSNRVLSDQHARLAVSGKEEREDGDKKRVYQLISIDKAIEVFVKENGAKAAPGNANDRT